MPDQKGSKVIKKKLMPRQKRFVEEYLIDLNATQATIRAGYSKKTAAEIGCENLRKPHIAAAISKAVQKRTERTEITQDQVLNELRKIGFADIRKVVSWGKSPGDADSDAPGTYPVELVPSDEIDDDTAASIAEVSLTQAGVRIKQHDKLSALEKMGRHVGLFPVGGINIHEEKVTTIIIQRFGDDLDDLVDPAE